MCKYGKRYSVSGTNVFSLWFQISYLFTIFIYSSVIEDVIIIYLNGNFNGSLVCFQRDPRQLRQTSIHTHTNFVTRTQQLSYVDLCLNSCLYFSRKAKGDFELSSLSSLCLPYILHFCTSSLCRACSMVSFMRVSGNLTEKNGPQTYDNYRIVALIQISKLFKELESLGSL